MIDIRIATKDDIDCLMSIRLEMLKVVNNLPKDYEYSDTDRFIECHDLEVFEDPDVRYYVGVIDKNRAGAKPKLLFRLNLAYNEWHEIGYVKLKEKSEE